MAYNLLEEPWIPIRTSSGHREHIAPWQIAENIRGAPVVAVDSPRPDFNGALIQFLIGLVQSSRLVPEMELDWEARFESPPTPDSLRQAFSQHHHAFSLDGEFPRFLQDLTMENGAEVSIRGLLIDPSGNDHFIKPQKGNGFCFACAATALFCLQTNSPEGGRGHLTGLRGGGPLTTIVLPPVDNVWQMIWLNVVSQEALTGADGRKYPSTPQDIFPWLAPTRTGETKGGLQTYPGDAHPFQIYWSMPRRIRLDFSMLQTGACDVCGLSSDRLIQRYFTKPYGVKYSGSWVHPLTPYMVDKNGAHSALKARSGSINYRNWVGLVLKSSAKNDSAKLQRLPARVVRLFTEKRAPAVDTRSSARLWGFGYDMEHMRARCWYEGHMPIPAVKDGRISNEYAKRSERMVRAAIVIAKNLEKCLKSAWFEKPTKVRGDTEFVTSAYWSRSEPLFFELLDALLSELRKTHPDYSDRTLRNWHKRLCRMALNIFDEYVTSGPIEDQNPARIATARRNLKMWSLGKNVREKILMIPQEAPEEDNPKS